MTRVLLVALALSVGLLTAAVYADYRSFDRTRGGYEPPYTGWTGTPVDWNETEQTAEGLRQRGRLVSSRLDCTTGMITFEVAGLRFDYREVSPRAVAVHRPREACAERGFEPEF